MRRPRRIRSLPWASCPEGLVAGGALGASDDGSTVVGTSRSDLGLEAFRWTSATGMVGLGFVPGRTNTVAFGVSSEGSVVVGGTVPAEAPLYKTEAFRWTSGDGMTGLGDSAGGIFSSQAFAVSADGTVIVGSGNTDSQSLVPNTAFIWTSDSGMVDLRDFLIAHGVSEVEDWTLSSAMDISADGRTIVGAGKNPAGQSNAWMATIPEPSTRVLAGTGFLGLLQRARRRPKFRIGAPPARRAIRISSA